MSFFSVHPFRTLSRLLSVWIVAFCLGACDSVPLQPVSEPDARSLETWLADRLAAAANATSCEREMRDDQPG